jgi:uncharacterized protein (DUF2147 family)
MPRRLILIFFFIVTLATMPGETRADDLQAISGFWLTDNKDGVVELYPCREKICGRFHWLKDDSPEAPSFDDKNPDPELRSKPLCGLQFMGGFEPRGNGYFSSGWIYSVHDGNTYSASLTLLGINTLELRGYFLIPLFGQSRIWQRTGPEPSCKR